MSIYRNCIIFAVIKASKIYIRCLYISGDDDLLDDFVHNYLRIDGLFCMRLIIKNTNDAIGKLAL